MGTLFFVTFAYIRPPIEEVEVGIMWKFIFAVLVWVNTANQAWGQHQNWLCSLSVQLKLCFVADSEADPCAYCEIQFVQLDKSGEQDDFFFLEVQSSDNCGSGGCNGVVYKKVNGKYQEINSFFGFFVAQSSPPSGTVPDLIYTHIEYPIRDYNDDGTKDKANVKIKYRWNNQKQTYEIADVLAIDIPKDTVALSSWRQSLLQEYRKSPPWIE
ncbi:MAG TPA: hypothetical protein PKA00_11655 [Saprospiraceae bacterium]|nr:hypothetical protein [Saprospiraceae bacterium]HMQ83559.1 hypothetical protein [Saprospiraceae bacterium]